MTKREVGNLGENYTCAYLVKKGWRIVSRNFQKRTGEIDIIAENGAIIAFVEVKARAWDGLERGAEAVTRSKQIKIIKTADSFLTENPTELQPRYDIAEVELSREKNPSVVAFNYIENAFDTSGVYTIN